MTALVLTKMLDLSSPHTLRFCALQACENPPCMGATRHAPSVAAGLTPASMVQVLLQETFGAMAKTEKVAFILEQVLYIAKHVVLCLHAASTSRCVGGVVAFTWRGKQGLEMPVEPGPGGDDWCDQLHSAPCWARTNVLDPAERYMAHDEADCASQHQAQHGCASGAPASPTCRRRPLSAQTPAPPCLRGMPSWSIRWHCAPLAVRLRD